MNELVDLVKEYGELEYQLGLSGGSDIDISNKRTEKFIEINSIILKINERLLNYEK